MVSGARHLKRVNFYLRSVSLSFMRRAYGARGVGSSDIFSGTLASLPEMVFPGSCNGGWHTVKMQLEIDPVLVVPRKFEAHHRWALQLCEPTVHT